MAMANMNFIFLLVAFLSLSCSSIDAHQKNIIKLKETKMSVYLHDVSKGPNATLSAVAGIAGKAEQWSFLQFGTVYVTDDPITETPDPNSTPIGRAQGMYATASLNGLNSHVMISIVFSVKAYNGSTLELQGNSKQLESVREVSVVSGTGKFRYARGYATFETYFTDASIGYSIIRCNLSVLH